MPSNQQLEFTENIKTSGNNKALNALALYGANSSGKSNLFKGFELIETMLNLSTKTNSTAKLPYDPFLLMEGLSDQPTEVEVIFLHNGVRYRYGFSYNESRIISEWLFRKKIGREVELFLREGDIIDVSSSFKGSKKLIDTAIEATRDNALFLSFCDMLNIHEANEIFKWFKNVMVLDGLNTSDEEFKTVKLWEDEFYREKIVSYLTALNLGFMDILVEKKEFESSDLSEELDDNLRKIIIEKLVGQVGFRVRTVHEKYDRNGKRNGQRVAWNFEEHESEGTQKAFHTSGPILRALLNGGVILIDEIEAKVHPEITLNIIRLFLSETTNPYNAQIIFATHDTNILHYANLRRDQINFIEKNGYEGSEVYSLSDFRYKKSNLKERHDVDKEKRYLEGRYGAIPMIGKSFRETISHWYGKEG
ncbi:MAG: ATP-binding protein [Bacteroidia bacterium]|nr:ATP-binding protein [Bacteroidia bacterium]